MAAPYISSTVNILVSRVATHLRQVSVALITGIGILSLFGPIPKTHADSAVPPAKRAPALPAIPVRGRNRIVYVWQGDLFVRDLPDGTPQRLTFDHRNGKPLWSPDGKWIAFCKTDRVPTADSYSPGRSPNQERLWLIRSNGTAARQVFREPLSAQARSLLIWSPTGLLTFIRNGDLFVENPTRPNSRRRLARIRQANAEISGIAWDRKGNRLAYGVERLRFRTPDWARSYEYQLRVVRANGTRNYLVQRTHGQSGLFLARWSPDGKHLLFFWDGEDSDVADYVGAVPLYASGLPVYEIPVSRHQTVRPPARLITTIDPKTEGRGMLESSLRYGDAVRCWEENLVFSPDGNYLLIGSGEGRRWNAERWLTRVNYRTQQRHRVTPWDVHAVTPRWSPDGKYIIYTACPQTARIESFVDSLWCMSGDGRHKRRVVGDGKVDCSDAYWLADSRHLVFTRGQSDKDRAPWMVDIRGNGLRRVAPPNTGQWELWTSLQ